MDQVAQWMRFESEFISSNEYDNPLQEVSMQVDFTSPDGIKHNLNGFWDGGKSWKVRFSPTTTGTWSYKTQSSDSGLDGNEGSFECVPYSGDNPLYTHGALRLSDNRRYIVHDDGTPFFWLSDTAWNGVLLSTEDEWEKYLKDRVNKNFTAIQYVTTQWRAAQGDREGRPAFTGKENIAVNPEFFQRMDKRVNALNDHGLIASPVLIWTCTAKDPGQTVPNDQLTILASYMVARYGAHQVIWMLGGDGNYREEKSERWKQIGRDVFGEDHHRLITMHPGGVQWIADEFRSEPWFSFNGYQSGHGDSDKTLRWLCEGPPAKEWDKEPVIPIINLEPNYEAHKAYHSKKPHDAHAVRRATYWSLLVSPPAGVTYGAQGIWSWQLEPDEPMDHKGSGVAQPWYDVINLPGSRHMKYLKKVFSDVRWWELVPAPELMEEQPGKDDPHKFVAAAVSADKSWAFLYLTERMTIKLNMDMLDDPKIIKWFNPRNGQWMEASEIADGQDKFTSPDEQDWVLLINGKEDI
ncbi:DUF4038 domain-containing protein [Candidatus Poribacteria bacterium]|nr:DUF4038 domain-containing protein [Candidatus Poribacteria bacterium]